MAVNANQRRKEKRILKKRVIAFVVIHALIGLHLWLWYAVEWHTIGAIDMQELFRNFIEKNVLTVGALFFLFFIAIGLLWGRIFCGWICHIGLAYDLIAALYEKLKITVRPFPTRFGTLMAGFILVWYYLSEAVKNRVKGEDTEMVIDMGLTEPWELLPGWINGTIVLVLVLFIMPLLLGRRTFCRNLCPWGVLLGLTNLFSAFKVRRTGNCTMCGECSTACPMDIDVSTAINTRLNVTSVACTNCLQCVAACPTNALSFSRPGTESKKKQKLPFLEPLKPVSLFEELAFWCMTMAVGLVYAELYGIGTFLAFSLGLIVAWLCWRGLVWMWARPKRHWVAPLLAMALVWGIVAKDRLAGYHFNLGHAAFENRDVATSQYHYEMADKLFWSTPTVLLYQLYRIYKGTNQEEKRQWIYDRYEDRRRSLGLIKDGGEEADG